MSEVALLAVGVAISPVPIAATMLLLAGSQPRVNGSAFAAGWVAGVAAAAAVFVLLARSADLGHRTPVWLAAVELTVGVVFLLLAAQLWRRRHRRREGEVPRWLTAADALTPARAAGLGAVLSGANPKNLALTLAAAIAVVEAGTSAGRTAGALIAFVLIGTVGVGVPLAAYAVAPGRAQGLLAWLRELLVRHDATVLAALGLVIGARFVWEGLAAF